MSDHTSPTYGSFDPREALSALAEDAERAAEPLPVTEVRRRGDQRRSRRRAAVGAGALSVALLAAVGVAAGTGMFAGREPGFAGGPSVTSRATTATPSVDTRPTAQEVAPQASDLYWHERGTFTMTRWERGAAVPDRLKCQAPSQPGDDNVHTRDYQASGQLTDVNVRTITYRFADEAAARQAYEQYRTAIAGCPQQLTTEGLARVGIGDWLDVPVTDGQAGFYEITYAEDDNSEDTTFEFIGLIQRGAYLVVVGYVSHGQDSNWDYTDEVIVGAKHPLIRSLPRVGERLPS